MKALIVLVAIWIVPLPALAIPTNVPSGCRDKNAFGKMPLRQHIDCMGHLLQSAHASLGDQGQRQAVADSLLDVRRHLQFTIGMVPGRVESVSPEQRRIPFLEYQMLSAEAMLLVSRLEMKILNTRYWDSPSADTGLFEISQRLQQVIATAYQKYGE